MRTALLLIFATAASTVAHAEPTGQHPHMLLDAELRQSWKAQAKAERGPVVGAIALCSDAAGSHEYDRAVYQGSEWAKVLQACLVAWAATDDRAHATTAIRFMTALLDDLDKIGDGAGGNEAARRDDGYAIRNLGPYTAIAYDWLYPQLTSELRTRARARWKAWLDWYREKGYRHDRPGTNYHAGFLLAATTAAIAGAGEDDGALWREVQQMWTKDMAAAFSEGGVLDGGDWPEGWQYGPLSVAEIALGARVMRGAGVEVPGVSRWLSALLRHHVYSLSPGDGVFAGGDTETEAPNIPPNVLTLDAVALGDASPDEQRWAKGELNRLALVDRDYLLYDALAAAGAGPVQPPRDHWPTWYLAANTGTLFARTRWDDQAIWFATTCHAAIDVDHRHVDAGNFVLSRGKDDVIVDPSPYGSQSSLTGNAPTVASGQLPKEYIPSQGSWGDRTGFDFATQRASGIVAARCDYSDQYKFQTRKSDVPDAFRDLVLLPSGDGRAAALVVVDRANTGGDDRGMFLRFRMPTHMALEESGASGTVGGTKLAIAKVAATSGRPAIGVPNHKDCFAKDTVKGTCDAARFPSVDYRIELAGPHPSAVHVISAVAAATPPAEARSIGGDGWAGVVVRGVRDAVVVWRTSGSGTLSYQAPPGTHVILDAPDAQASITAKRSGDNCAVSVTGGGSIPARPAIIGIDASCNVTLDPEAPAASAVGTKPRKAAGVRSQRPGCCDTGSGPASPLALSLLVTGVLRRPRRAATSRARARSAH
jgi:hypothetical protein